MNNKIFADWQCAKCTDPFLNYINIFQENPQVYNYFKLCNNTKFQSYIYTEYHQ